MVSTFYLYRQPFNRFNPGHGAALSRIIFFGLHLFVAVFSPAL